MCIGRKQSKMPGDGLQSAGAERQGLKPDRRENIVAVQSFSPQDLMFGQVPLETILIHS